MTPGEEPDLEQRLRSREPIVRPRATRPPSLRARGLRNSLLIGSVTLLLGLGYGILDSRRIRVEHVVVPFSGLKPALDGFTIIQLSDLHSKPDFKISEEGARLLEGLQGNLTVMSGDLRNAGGSAQIAVQGARQLLRSVISRMPVYAVQGNNDTVETMRLLEAEGITVLDNRSVPIADGLWLAGWNPYPKRHATLEQALSEIPRGAPAILASHSPDVILESGFERARLILAGHTHGVQIRVPGLPSPLTLTRVGWRYTQGLYSLNGNYLYINCGLGTTMIPLRVYSAPEITVLRLNSLK